MDGRTSDYQRCVDISTAAAQKELLGPGILAPSRRPVGFGLGFSDPLRVRPASVASRRRYPQWSADGRLHVHHRWGMG